MQSDLPCCLNMSIESWINSFLLSAKTILPWWQFARNVPNPWWQPAASQSEYTRSKQGQNLCLKLSMFFRAILSFCTRNDLNSNCSGIFQSQALRHLGLQWEIFCAGPNSCYGMVVLNRTASATKSVLHYVLAECLTFNTPALE